MTMAVNYFPLGYSLANVFLIGMNSFVFAWQNSLPQLSFNIEKNVFSLYQYLLVWISCLECKKHKLILFSKNNKLEFCRIYCVFKGSHLSTRAWPLHIVRRVYGSSNNFGIWKQNSFKIWAVRIPFDAWVCILARESQQPL